MKKLQLRPFLLIMLVLIINACSNNDEEPFISLKSPELHVARVEGTYDIAISTNMSNLQASSNSEWCKVAIIDNKLQIQVALNPNDNSRQAYITVKSETTTAVLALTQRGLTGALEDVKLIVNKADASSSESTNGIEASIDGDYTTVYRSSKDNSSSNYFPITLNYYFKDLDKMDYLIYNPQINGTEGNIKEVELWIATKEEPNLIKYGDYDFKGISTASRIDFTKTLLNPTQIQFVVKSANGYLVCSEMEFYKKIENFDFLTIFTDNSCSEIKKNITERDILKIESSFYRGLALDIYHKTYDKEFRIQKYESYQNPKVMSSFNRTKKYGLNDNPTGIYAQEGEEIILFAGDHDVKIDLFIQKPYNKTAGTRYELSNGFNKIIAPHDGLMYIIYYTDAGTEPPVRINIVTGIVNGYFDIAIHSEQDWNRLLNKASFDFFDLKSKKVMMTFETEAFRQYTPSGLALANLYDSIIYLEYEITGLTKYKREYKNRLYMVAINNDQGYMYTKDYYTGYALETQYKILNPNNLRKDPWGVAHEFGHVHQIISNFRWNGVGEVTNNVQTLYVQTSLGNKSWLISRNHYQNATKDIIDNNKAYNNATCDLVARLVPFWQLKLYCTDVLGMKDYYPDLHEALRNAPNTTGKGDSQLFFVKTACDVAELDLTEFFSKWGFLTPIYFDQNFIITQTEIDATKAEIAAKKYPKPKHNNIHEITDSNIASFK